MSIATAICPPDTSALAKRLNLHSVKWACPRIGALESPLLEQEKIEPSISHRKAALTAGISYLVIIVCGIFAEFGVRQQLYVVGDAQKTLANIASNEGLFKIGIASDLLMLLADVVVAWALFVFFAQVNKQVSLFAAFLRLVQASVIGASVVSLLQVLKVTDPAQAALLTGAHGDGYKVGLVFFGVCCIVVGWLSLRSGQVPKWIGVLLYLAGAGYLVDSFGSFLSASYSPEFSNIVLLPAFVAEVSFAVWLVAKGGKQPAT